MNPESPRNARAGRERREGCARVYTDRTACFPRKAGPSATAAGCVVVIGVGESNSAAPCIVATQFVSIFAHQMIGLVPFCPLSNKERGGGTNAQVPCIVYLADTLEICAAMRATDDSWSRSQCRRFRSSRLDPHALERGTRKGGPCCRRSQT